MLRSGWNLRGESKRGARTHTSNNMDRAACGAAPARTSICSLKGQLTCSFRGQMATHSRLPSSFALVPCCGLRRAQRRLRPANRQRACDRHLRGTTVSAVDRVLRPCDRVQRVTGMEDRASFPTVTCQRGAPPTLRKSRATIVPPEPEVRKMPRSPGQSSAWSGGRSRPSHIAFAVHDSAAALQNGSVAGSPRGSRPTAQRYALPEQM